MCRAHPEPWHTRQSAHPCLELVPITPGGLDIGVTYRTLRSSRPTSQEPRAKDASKAESKRMMKLQSEVRIGVQQRVETLSKTWDVKCSGQMIYVGS